MSSPVISVAANEIVLIMKLRCLLIDDEPPALKVLASYISNINGLEIVRPM